MKASAQPTTTPVARVAITCPHCGEEFTPAQVAEVRAAMGESEDAMEGGPPMSMQDAISRELDDPEKQAERESRAE